VQRPGRGEELVDEPDAESSERDALRPVAQPVRIRALHPAADRFRSLERFGIQNQLARGVGAQEDVAAGQAFEVDLRQGDRVAGARLGPWRPVRHVGELADELVLALLRLRERVAVQLATADPPAPGVVARRDPGLHLEDQDPMVGMDDDEVRLAVPGRPAVAHRAEPLRIRVEVKGISRQGSADPFGDEALGGLPVCLHATSWRRLYRAASTGTPCPRAPGAADSASSSNSLIPTL
jgi:hypothetical protein